MEDFDFSPPSIFKVVFTSGVYIYVYWSSFIFVPFITVPYTFSSHCSLSSFLFYRLNIEFAVSSILALSFVTTVVELLSILSGLFFPPAILICSF